MMSIRASSWFAVIAAPRCGGIQDDCKSVQEANRHTQLGNCILSQSNQAILVP